jgi:heme exporter protein C
MRKAFPILGVLTAIFLSYALYLALVVAPREQTMGDVQRIFYYHALGVDGVPAVLHQLLASVQYLVRRNPSTDKVANWILITVAVVTCIASVVIATVPSLRSHAERC